MVARFLIVWLLRWRWWRLWLFVFTIVVFVCSSDSHRIRVNQIISESSPQQRGLWERTPSWIARTLALRPVPCMHSPSFSSLASRLSSLASRLSPLASRLSPLSPLFSLYLSSPLSRSSLSLLYLSITISDIQIDLQVVGSVQPVKQATGASQK